MVKVRNSNDAMSGPIIISDYLLIVSSLCVDFGKVVGPTVVLVFSSSGPSPSTNTNNN